MMKIIIFILLFPLSVLCYFENRPHTADGMASANIITSIDAGSSYMIYNPGSLSRIRKINLGTTFVKNLWGLDMTLKDEVDTFNNYQISASIPILNKYGSIGVNIWRFSSSYYQENIYTGGWGYEILKNINFGFSINVYSWKVDGSDYITLNDYFIDKQGISSLGVNLGVEYTGIKDILLGLCLNNINEPDMGLQAEDRIPLSGSCGITKKCEYKIDLSLGFTLEKDYSIVSIAYKQLFFKELLQIKLGIQGDKYKISSTTYKLNVGLGINLGFLLPLDFYYTLNYPLNDISDHYGNHLFSLNYKI